LLSEAIASQQPGHVPTHPETFKVANHRLGQGQRSSDEETAAFRAAIGIEDHLQFLEQLSANLRWISRSRTQLRDAVKGIRKKDQDKGLFLGVIGEFSSGKSTLINALLRDDLLRTDVLQATTSTATLLSYGQPGAKIFYQNGKKEQISIKDRARFQETLHRVTTEEAVAQYVDRVHIYHPSENLRAGLVIVDTPGANADNPRHARVTCAAIRHLCDAVIVVVPAHAPVSQTLVNLLRDHLAEILHRCVFLVTKLDLIRRAWERGPLLHNIRSRLGQELGLTHPKVFPAVPQVVIDALPGKSGQDEPTRFSQQERGEFLQQFVATEKAIWQALLQQRFLI